MMRHGSTYCNPVKHAKYYWWRIYNSESSGEVGVVRVPLKTTSSDLNRVSKKDIIKRREGKVSMMMSFTSHL